MKSCLCITLNISHLVCDIIFHRCTRKSQQSTTSRLFNLWTLLTIQLLTYKDVSVCKLSHMRTCLFATCHKISNVLSRPPCFSWSVILRGWCWYSMMVMHTDLLRHMAGENRGQCLDKWTGVGRTRVGGHETRPKPKPNVDYYLLGYLLLLFLLLLSNVY